MPISVVCPSCHSKVRASDKLAGKKIKCPRCGASIRGVDRSIANQSSAFLKKTIIGVVIPLFVIVIGGLAVEYLKPKKDHLGNEGQGSPEKTGRGSDEAPASKTKPAPATADDLIAKVRQVVGVDLVSIPAGEFFMGSNADDKDALPDEKPRHKVTISHPFYLGKYKVTVGQFRRFVEATGYKSEAEKAGEVRTWKKPGFEQTDEHPVLYVSWNDAGAFCQWLAKETSAIVRLPREAEWEYSCRARTTTKFYFGDNEADLGDYAWYTKNTSDKGTQPCGVKKPNGFGLYDMHGLTWEWCADGKRTYKDQHETDPEGPTRIGVFPVIRGGSFRDPLRNCRAATRRYDNTAANRNDLLGFRVLVSR